MVVVGVSQPRRRSSGVLGRLSVVIAGSCSKRSTTSCLKVALFSSLKNRDWASICCGFDAEDSFVFAIATLSQKQTNPLHQSRSSGLLPQDNNRDAKDLRYTYIHIYGPRKCARWGVDDGTSKWPLGFESTTTMKRESSDSPQKSWRRIDRGEERCEEDKSENNGLLKPLPDPTSSLNEAFFASV